MKEYKSPELEVVKFATESIMTASSTSNPDNDNVAGGFDSNSAIPPQNNSIVGNMLEGDPVKKMFE